MKSHWKLSSGCVASVMLLAAAPVVAQEFWETAGGATTVVFDLTHLDALGVTPGELGEASSFSSDNPPHSLSFPIDPTFQLTFTVDSDGAISLVGGSLSHSGGIDLVTSAGGSMISQFATEPDASGSSLFVLDGALAGDGLAVADVVSTLDPETKTLLIRGENVLITPGLANQLGDPGLAGETIGSLVIAVEAIWTGGDFPSTLDDYLRSAGQRGVCTPHNGNNDGAGGSSQCCAVSGPDVIVGVLPNVSNYAAVGGIEAFTVGTTSCNLGAQDLLWQASNTNHPVIGQNMYRLKDNRFEQVGMSWLKHGFLALANNACGCGCINPGNGALLGVGCSDPYSSGLNGDQDGNGGATGGLGPRFQVDAHTGAFSFPYMFQGMSGNSIYKRIQVEIADLDPAQDGGGLYFLEGHYVTPDDAAFGNQDNNASHRQVAISGAGSAWNASFTGMPITVREQPAIRAWQNSDASVQEVDVRAQDSGGDEGLLILAGKATNLGGGQWHYEYALHNLNSHRGVQQVTIPFPAGTVISNAGFHDVDYHSGDGEGGVTRSGTDWTITIGIDQISWNTQTLAQNSNANALLWGTTYNFRFDANVAPDVTEVQMDYFRGTGPSFALASIVGPPLGPGDCQPNGIGDDQDIAGGTSQDCNGNLLPDECEIPPIGSGPDCNLDGVPDDCQVAGNDCNSNGIPDDCEPDCNSNGTADECDIADLSSDDCDLNGVPDECQADCDSDGTPDTCEIGIILFQDDFETDQGWTVTNDASLTDGAWERGDPTQTLFSGFVVQPEDDHSTNGTLCFVTDASGPITSQSDVDGGPTNLISPTVDLSIGGATITYSYWFYSVASGAHNADTLFVDASFDGGANWVSLASHSTNSTDWQTNSILIDSVGVPTANMQFRFSVEDAGNDSFTEALIDDVRITIPDCPADDPCHDADVNCDGNVNSLDLAEIQSPLNWSMTAGLAANERADVDGSGTVNSLDLAEVQSPLNWANSTGPCDCGL